MRDSLIQLLKLLRLDNFAIHTKEFFYQLLRVDFIRAIVAGVRYFWFAKVLRRFSVFETSSTDIGVNTILHNKKRIVSFAELAVIRSNLLLYPLSSLHIDKNAPVLCIGPRTEGELLNLLSLKFRNVHGLDLFSYSPWIDAGDMHAMPYADDSFSTIVVGWVLAYSDNRKKAAEEILRVCRPGGTIAIGAEWRQESTDSVSKRMGYEMPDKTRLNSAGEILALFGSRVDRVLLFQDIPSFPVKKWQMLVIFSVL